MNNDSGKIYEVLKVRLRFTVSTIQYGVRGSDTSCVRGAVDSNVYKRAEGDISIGLSQFGSRAPCSLVALLGAPAGLPAPFRRPPCFTNSAIALGFILQAFLEV